MSQQMQESIHVIFHERNEFQHNMETSHKALQKVNISAAVTYCVSINKDIDYTGMKEKDLT
jgi:hypothetical protein